ncbi:MAG: GxxExxY protein, partial [Spirochaetaceae bacterium]
MAEIIHKEICFKLMNLAYTVHNILGSGLLESAYEEAMCIELRLSNIPF